MHRTATDVTQGIPDDLFAGPSYRIVVMTCFDIMPPNSPRGRNTV